MSTAPFAFGWMAIMFMLAGGIAVVSGGPRGLGLGLVCVGIWLALSALIFWMFPI